MCFISNKRNERFSRKVNISTLSVIIINIIFRNVRTFQGIFGEDFIMRMKSKINIKSHQQKHIEDDESEIPDDLELSSKSNDESIKFNIIPDIPLKQIWLQKDQHQTLKFRLRVLA